jgi:hypothetical protein
VGGNSVLGNLGNRRWKPRDGIAGSVPLFVDRTKVTSPSPNMALGNARDGLAASHASPY